MADETGLAAALTEALQRDDGAAVARLTARLRVPGQAMTAEALLSAALAWPGEEAAAALRMAAEAIRSFDIAELVESRPPSRLARLFGAEHPMQRARRRHEEAAERLAPAEAALADCVARLDAGVARLAGARAAAAEQAAAIGILIRDGETALAAGLARMGGPNARADFAAAEAAARRTAQLDAIAARLQELTIARLSAQQAMATADQLMARDRMLAQAIRALRDEVLPHWHLQLAEAIALLSAADAAAALRGVAKAAGPAARDLAGTARDAALRAIESCTSAIEAATSLRAGSVT